MGSPGWSSRYSTDACEVVRRQAVARLRLRQTDDRRHVHLTRARADDQRDGAPARHEGAGLGTGRDHGAGRDLGVLLRLGDDVEPVLLTGEELGRDVDRIADHAGRDRDLLRSAGDDEGDPRVLPDPLAAGRFGADHESLVELVLLGDKVERESLGTENVAGLLGGPSGDVGHLDQIGGRAVVELDDGARR